MDRFFNIGKFCTTTSKFWLTKMNERKILIFNFSYSYSYTYITYGVLICEFSSILLFKFDTCKLGVDPFFNQSSLQELSNGLSNMNFFTRNQLVKNRFFTPTPLIGPHLRIANPGVERSRGVEGGGVGS